MLARHCQLQAVHETRKIRPLDFNNARLEAVVRYARMRMLGSASQRLPKLIPPSVAASIGAEADHHVRISLLAGCCEKERQRARA